MNGHSSSFLTIEKSMVVYDQQIAQLPGLASASNGDLWLAFCDYCDGIPGSRLHLCRSRDQGTTWGEHEVVIETKRWQGSVHSSIGLTTLRDGTLLMPYNDISTYVVFWHRESDLYLACSTDDGHSWTMRRIPNDLAFNCAYGNILELRSGRLLWQVWSVLHKGHPWRSGVFISEDHGMTWPQYVTVGYDPAAEEPSDAPVAGGIGETTLAELADGRILGLMKNRGAYENRLGYLLRTVSSDGGHTWSAPQRTNLVAGSPKLHMLPSGRLILGYRNIPNDETGQEGCGIGIATTGDDGLTWTQALVLPEPKGAALAEPYMAGYPSFANLHDGGVYVVYYSHDERMPGDYTPPPGPWSTRRGRRYLKVFKRYIAGNVLREGEP